jgi:HK97 family phage major capsid protein
VPSAAVKEKINELETLKVRSDTALTTASKTGLSAELDLELKTLSDRMQTLSGEIAAERKLDDYRADGERTNNFLNNPVNRLPAAGNGDDAGKKALLDHGWEIKGGTIYAPNSLEGHTVRWANGELKHMGKVAMYPESVLFGDIPTDDPKQAEYYTKTRAIHRPEYRAAYGKHLFLTVKYGSEKTALQMMAGHEQKALSEGLDTSGGALVPPDIMAEILAHLPQWAIMRANCRVQPTSRDVLRWPAVAANAGTYGGISGANIYSSGFVGSWVGETPAFTDTDPSFQTFDITIKKVRVATKLSNDFIADSAADVMAWLAQNGAVNMGITEDWGFILGNGTGLQPLGLMNVGISTADVEGSTANLVVNTTADAGSAPKLIKNMVYTLPAQYRSRAKWIMRSTIEGKIRSLVDGSGRYLWPPFTGSGFASTEGEPLLGRPVLHSDWMADDGTDANKVVFLGDLGEYIIGQRTQITSLVLRERFADSDQTGIVLFERIGGGMYNKSAALVGIV